MTDFSRDIEAGERALKSARLWGTLGAFFTLGLWSNERKVSQALEEVEDARRDAQTLAALQSDVARLHEFLDEAIEENGVRVALCVFPDVALSGQQTYGPYWQSIRTTVLQRDNYACRHEDGCCVGPLQIHHIRPLSKGGTNDLLNLVTLCRHHHGLQHPGNPTFWR